MERHLAAQNNERSAEKLGPFGIYEFCCFICLTLIEYINLQFSCKRFKIY